MKIAICLLAMVAVTAAVAVYGLWERNSGLADAPVGGQSLTMAMPAPPQMGPPPEIPSAPPLADALNASFDALSAEVGSEIGLAYAPVDEPDQVTLLGSWVRGPAWSTIKVPLALALLQETGEATSAMRSAITVSDNAAAESIWNQLGGGEAAAVKVEGVLSAAGDSVTDVPNERRRAEFSIFGQTDWSLVDQVRFLTRIDCDPAAGPVTTMMGEVSGGQRWGLGSINGAQFKGGWGPGIDGRYLVRQYGVVPTPDGGRVAVAIAAVADSGGFGDGTAILDRVAGWFEDHLAGVRGGHCPVG